MKALTQTTDREDPYLAWALQTQFRYQAGQAEKIRLVGKLRGDHQLTEALAPVENSNASIAARSILGTRYFSAWMSHPDPAALAKLREIADFVLAEPGMWPIGQAGAGVNSNSLPQSVDSVCSQTVVIGVIDGLCGFANQKFCVGNESRLDYFWDQAGDQGSPAGSLESTWSCPAAYGYGRELQRPELNQLIAELPAPGSGLMQRAAAEKGLYRKLGQQTPEDADWSHGTHVLDTVLTGMSECGCVGDGESRPGVIYVQLPQFALLDTSSRGTAAYVLDGIDYIVSHAADTSQIVINLSLGAFAGPHDGSSLVEQAIDEVVVQYAGRLSVVVAAGNAGKVVDNGTGEVKACHARATLDPADRPQSGSDSRSATLVLDIDLADTTESFVEIWLPELCATGTTSRVSVELQHEKLIDLCLNQVAPDQTAALERGGQVLAMVVNASGACRVPNGVGGMVLIAIGHTRDCFGHWPAPSGRWQIRITNLSEIPITFDAWIERRDMPGELLGYRPQYGFVAERPFFTNGGSLGSLANGRKTIVVGALDPAKTGEIASISNYSSRGYQARIGECNDRSVARRGPDEYRLGNRDAAGFFSGSAKDLAGTSMASARLSAELACAVSPTGRGRGSNPLEKLQSGI